MKNDFDWELALKIVAEVLRAVAKVFDSEDKH